MPNLEILAQHNRERLAKAKEQYLGKTFSSNNFGDFIVIDYVNNKNITVEFITTGYQTKTTTKEINQGKIADRLKPSVFGVGIIGNKYPINDNGSINYIYKVWNNILDRCYNEKTKLKYKAYSDCSTSNNFKYYEYFYEWFTSQKGCDERFEVDKDLLVKGNRIYSENTCILLPKEINLALSVKKSQRGQYLIGVQKNGKNFLARCSTGTGERKLGYYTTEIEAFNAYKQAKENYLKELANKWKDKIDIRAYNALMAYEIEVTD